MRYFCTYFDSTYLPRGLALYHSLAQHVRKFTLLVLCMDQPTLRKLRKLDLPNLRTMTVRDLTKRHPALSAARANRGQFEFYFTCTPWLLLDGLEKLPKGELLTYLDADLFFFDSPAPIYDELTHASVGIIAHRFPRALTHLECYGRFNVGWVSIRKDQSGLACARRWADQCADWCYSRLEPNRYADQKYLDEWPKDFAHTVVIEHPGANVAPWNVLDAEIRLADEAVTIQGKPLIFYHFHALREIAPGLWDSGLQKYGAAVSGAVRRGIYFPYIRRISEPDRAPLELLPVSTSNNAIARKANSYLYNQLRAAELDRGKRLAVIEEQLLKLAEQGNELQAARSEISQLKQDRLGAAQYLAEVEADRSARLENLKTMQGQLDAAGIAGQKAESHVTALEQKLSALEAESEARRQSLIEMQQQLAEHGQARHFAESRIRELEPALDGTKAYLRAVENDAAARLESIKHLESQLHQAQVDHERTVGYVAKLEADSAARLTALQSMQQQLEEHGRARHLAESRVRELEQGLAGTQAYLHSVETDSASRLESIKALESQLHQAQKDHQGNVEYLSKLETDSAARLAALESMQQQLEEHGRARHLAESRVRELEQGLAGTQAYLHSVETDSASRLESIKALESQLHRAQKDHRDNVEYLSKLEIDSAARLTALESMQQQLEEHGRARHLAESRVRELTQALDGTSSYLQTVEIDSAKRLEYINQLKEKIHELQAGHQRTVEYLTQVDADRAARLQIIVELQKKLDSAACEAEPAEK